MANGKRLLFFDIVRVVSVAAIVLWHMGFGLLDQPALFGVLDMRLGPVAVYLMLFVSGAVLQVSHPRSWEGSYWAFISRRLSRIYPAFWFALGLSMFFAWGVVMASKPIDVLISIAGLAGAVGQWSGVPGGYMHTTYWFMGIIIVLYLTFPFISKEINSSPHISMFTFGMVSLASMVWISTTWIGAPTGMRWFPLCSLVWFALGVYIVRVGRYPKTVHSNTVILALSEMTFYVFLLHMTEPFTWLMVPSPILYGITVIWVSFLVMKTETWLRRQYCFLKKSELPIGSTS
jgi:peptidoglycan/LPS O-acetylase OafA/YrhL